MIRTVVRGLQISGYDVVRALLAGILLAAAALKSYQLATEPTLGNSFLESRWFLMLVVEFELLFGFWLLANLYPSGTQWFSVACFSAFAVVSLYKAISGATSCGCFGSVRVNPWVTLALDTGAVLALVSAPPRHRRSMPAPGFTRGFQPRLIVVSVLWALVGIPAGLAMANPRVEFLSDDGFVPTGAGMVVLESEKWLGKPLPLLEYIDIGDQLRQGKWLLVLYHHDCPDCQELLGPSRDSRLNSLGDASRVVLVEMPPHRQRSDEAAFADCVSRNVAQLTDSRRWFAETPTAIHLAEGVVISVQTRQQLLAISAHARKAGLQTFLSPGRCPSSDSRFRGAAIGTAPPRHPRVYEAWSCAGQPLCEGQFLRRVARLCSVRVSCLGIRVWS